ncbi:MAG: IS110 family transposase [Candidatus Sericytochromatia bacterium]
MIYCGIDPHKKKHVAVLCDPQGKKISEKSFNNNIEGYQELVEWSSINTEEVIFGIENPQSYGRWLAQYLKVKEKKVYSVPSSLTGLYRRRSTARDKNDENDALAVARAVIQEEEKLKEVLVEGKTVELSILVEHYDNLKEESIKIVNRVHSYLLNVDLYGKVGRLTRIKDLTLFIERCENNIEGVAGMYWNIIKSVSNRLLEVLKEMKKYLSEMEIILKELKADKLLEEKGVGVYLAAKILGISGNANLFKNESSFANYAGVAPISCSSGRNTNYRVNPGGNRQLNYAIHTIAKSKMTYEEKSKEYYNKKKSEGKTPRESLRCLKRQVCKQIFKILENMESINKIKKVSIS